MKKWVVVTVILVMFFRSETVGAQGVGYEINSFESSVLINKDTTIQVTEKIEVNFFEESHGIYRFIPQKWNNGSTKIMVWLKVLAVEDEAGKVKFDVKKESGNLEIKIGDAQKSVVGRKTYTITYLAKNMIRKYAGHDELYWNVTGEEWDTDMAYVFSVVESPEAKIVKTKCFTGGYGDTEQECDGGVVEGDLPKAVFSARKPLGKGTGMTIVVGLDKDNNLVWPSWWQRTGEWLVSNWYYILFMIPALFAGWKWWKMGRDIKDRWGDYNAFVYAPIRNLSAGEAGVLVDQKVTAGEMTAEILEIAKKGYLKIEKIDKDFLLVKLKEADLGLVSYEKVLLEGIFKSKKKEVKLSELKYKMSEEYKKFTSLLYQDATDKGWFAQSPEKTRTRWLVGAGIYLFGGSWIVGSVTQDPILVIWVLINAVLVGVFGYLMPRRTEKGYKTYRDLRGLKYYIEKGKWRYEVYEKNLFVEEILPLAVALGVVTKLSEQMNELGVTTPLYASAFGSNMSGWRSFNNLIVPTMQSANSGRSGSGFSGGFSGGGGGGGGGGRW